MPSPHPPELRERVIQRAQETGVRAAATEHGVSPASVSRWCRKAGVATVPHEQTENARAVAAMRWEERRGDLLHEMGEAAELALETAVEALEDGKVRDAQSAAVTMAILVDKAQLLSGGPTSRNEHLSGLDAELERLAKQVAAA